MKLSSVINVPVIDALRREFHWLIEFANDVWNILSPPLPQTTKEVRDWLRQASQEHYLLHEEGIPSRLKRMRKNNITVDYSELNGEEWIIQAFRINPYTQQIITEIVTNIQE